MLAVVGLFASLMITRAALAAQPAAGGQLSDFALFDGTDPVALETGVACGAKLGSSKNAIAFTYFVAVSNFNNTAKVLREETK